MVILGKSLYKILILSGSFYLVERAPLIIKKIGTPIFPIVDASFCQSTPTIVDVTHKEAT